MFEKKMRKKGLTVKAMGDDGACLFRAVADQVYGDQDMHAVVRKHCMDYIVSKLIKRFQYFLAILFQKPFKFLTYYFICSYVRL